eukprot:1123779-Pleurochrysis_carterae.AAC.1
MGTSTDSTQTGRVAGEVYLQVPRAILMKLTRITLEAMPEVSSYPVDPLMAEALKSESSTVLLICDRSASDVTNRARPLRQQRAMRRLL